MTTITGRFVDCTGTPRQTPYTVWRVLASGLSEQALLGSSAGNGQFSFQLTKGDYILGPNNEPFGLKFNVKRSGSFVITQLLV